MPWYLDLVAVGLMAVGGIGYLQVYHRRLMNSTPTTKEGYKVRFERLMLLEGEWRLGNKFKERNLNLRAIQERDSEFDSPMIMKMMVYYGIASLVIWLTGWSIHPLALTAGYGIVTLGFAHMEMRKNYKMALVHINQLPITAPAEFQEYGRYAWNPFDLKSALSELESLKSQQQSLAKRIERLQSNLTQPDEGFGSAKDNLESSLFDADKLARHIEALTTCIQEELLTNDDFLITESGNESKQLQPNAVTPPESSETAEPIESKLPYHIEEMKGIASNPNLPREVVERAEKLVKKHDEQEVERKRQKEIDDALLSIKTVENFYEKNEEMRVSK